MRWRPPHLQQLRLWQSHRQCPQAPGDQGGFILEIHRAFPCLCYYRVHLLEAQRSPTTVATE